MTSNEKVGPRGTTPGETDPQTSPHQRDQVTTDLNGDGRQTPEGDVRLYLDVLYGGGIGFCHVVWGEGWYRNDKGKLQHRFWSETRERLAFPYPDDDDAIVAKILELAAQDLDVYVATNLVRSATSRKKNDVESLWCLHADADNGLNLDDVAKLGWCAISSGTPGHYHLYVPFSERVTEEQFRALSGALIKLLGADNKKAGNDVLRPPCTRNFKPTADGGDPVPVRWAVRP